MRKGNSRLLVVGFALTLMCLPGLAFAKVDQKKKSWSWKTSKFDAILLVATSEAVILGSIRDGKTPKLLQFPLSEFSDADILYVQDWRKQMQRGIERYRAAESAPVPEARVSLFQQSEALQNPRAKHYMATSLALHGNYEEAQELFADVRNYYRDRIDFQPKFSEALIAAMNNYALTQLRNRKVKSAFRTYGQIEGLGQSLPPALLHNLAVYSYIDKTPPSKHRKLVSSISERTEQAAPSNPRHGWQYLRDDGTVVHDRICIGCSGKGHLACPVNTCKNGVLRYKERRSRVDIVAGKPRTTWFTVDRAKDCPKCKNGRVRCRQCTSGRIEKQNDKSVDSRFK